MLRQTPSAALLLQYGAHVLLDQLANLKELGLTDQQVASAVFKSYTVLLLPPAHLAGLEAVLQQELLQQVLQLPGQAARELLIKLLQRAPRALNCSLETARERLAWLAKVRTEGLALRNIRQVFATPTSSAGSVDALCMNE
jgi:hypothetical protein